MYRWATIVALLLQAVPRAVPQPIVLKSTSHAVQLEVFVNDPSGRFVHGLQKNDFVVTDNGYPREIRIFAGEIDASQTGVYSNRLGMGDSRIVTAIVIDAVPRPNGLQKNAGIFASNKRSSGLLWCAGRLYTRSIGWNPARLSRSTRLAPNCVSCRITLQIQTALSRA